MLRFLTEWRDRSRAFRDERTLPRDSAYAKQHVADRIDAAWRARQARDRETALQIWQEIRAQYPDITMESPAALHLLMSLQEFDAAEGLMQEGCKRYPRNPFYLEGSAHIAVMRGDHEEAVRRYARLRKKFPRVVKGYTDAVNSLINLGRLDEADKVLSAVAANSTEVGLISRYARLAMTRKDWPTALLRWQYPHHGPTAALGVAQCFKEMRRFDDAEHVIAVALRIPTNDAIALRTELALIAETRADWAEAALRWDTIRKSAPTILDGYCHAALAYARCGRGPEAETILQEAMQRFPSEAQLWLDYARAAERRGDTDEAAVRWEQFRVKFPTHPVT